MGARLRKIGKSGYYFACFYDGSRDPKETSIPLKVTTKNDAMKKFVAICDKVDKGKLDPWNPEEETKKLTLTESIDTFLETKQHLRPASIRAYRTTLTGLTAQTPPNLMLAHLDASHVRSCIHAKMKQTKKTGEVEVKEVSPATKRHRRRHLKVFVRWAKGRGHLHTDPLKPVKLPKAGKRKPEYLTPSDLERVLSAIDYHVETKRAGGHVRDGEVTWLKDVILLAVGTGMRRGEVCSLRWRDVDLDSGFICVRNTESFQTKTGDERWIPIVADARKVIERLHAQRTDDLDGPVLTYGDGRPVVASYASKRFKKFIRLAKLDERYKFHTLRHTTASWLTMKGVSPAIIQQILGHADISTTMIYAHLAPETMKNAIEMAFQ